MLQPLTACHSALSVQVLRANRSTFMTCAETFLHDPLVEWSKGAAKASAQTAGGEEVGATAPAILMPACACYRFECVDALGT